MPKEPRGPMETIASLLKVRPPTEKRLTIGKTKVGNLMVSTVYVSDLSCFETAILVPATMKAHPVERYDGRCEAIEGHERWVEELPGLKEITQLGYGDIVQPETIKL